jgi:hypothetical protein
MTLVASLNAAAQVSETRGTIGLVEGRRYMVAFPQVWASKTEKPLPQPMVVYISSKVKATVRVKSVSDLNSAGKIDREYTLKPNEILKVPVSTAYMNVESEAREGFGLSVTADKPISVFTYQAWMGNGELARHLPVEAWGKNYYTMNFYQDRYNAQDPQYRPSQILLIAAYDNTVISYTPTRPTEGGRETPSIPKNGTGQVILNKGDTYLIKSKIDARYNKEFVTDLSGTWIRSSRPVGVVSGHTKVAIMRYPDVLPPTGMFAAEAHFVRNNVHDCMLPFEMAGTKFVTVPAMYTPSRVTGKASADFGIDDDRGDVIRFIALEDNTTVKSMRQDGSSLKNERILRRGETFLVTALEVATYWESDKPMLMGQYGKSYAKIIPPAVEKGGDATQGHPTVESGMPMLEYIPSVDRWANYGVFHSPEGMDNFFNIVFNTAEIGKIKVDGRALNSAFGGSMRPLQGTPFSYIRTPIGQGDHIVESTSDDIKWAAWTYGSLDGLQQGRAYGTPIAIDLAIPCPDSLDVKEVVLCGDVTGEGKILPENSTCGSIFGIYADNLVNYTLEEDPAFNSGDKTVKFWLKVVDKTKDASGVVRVVSRSGKFVDRTYTYIADKIDWDPKKIDFGTIPFNTPVCKTITIKNLSPDRPVNVSEVKAKYLPDVYKFDPTSFIIDPGGEKVVNVCATIQDTREKLDTVLVKLDCFEKPITELRVRGEEPTIYVGDQTWVNVPANHPGIVKPVEIINGGKVDLIITGYDEALVASQNKFFDFKNQNGTPLKSIFPLTLPPGERHPFTVTYSPQGEANVPHTMNVPFYSNALVVDSIAELKGNGVIAMIYAAAEPWNVRVIDVVQTAQGINEYTQQVKFSNSGQVSVEFQQPTIQGPDAGAFRIVNTGNTGGFPTSLVSNGTQNDPNKERYITIAFVPTELAGRGAERDNYVADLVFPNSSSESPNYTVALSATAWQPHAKGADYDFGTFQVGAPLATTTITLVNENKDDVTNPTTGDTKGTHDVVITGIRIVDMTQNFDVQYGPTAANPWRLAPGETRDMTVSFNPRQAGTFTTKYKVITTPADMTDGAAPYTPSYTLKGLVTGGDFLVVGDYVEQYVFNAADMTIKISHNDAQPRRYTIGSPTGPDAANFTVIEQFVDVPSGSAGIVNVRFIPTAVSKLRNNQDGNFLSSDKAKAQSLSLRNSQFSTEVEITDNQNGKTSMATLTGDGLFLETTNFVGKDNTPGKLYQVEVSKSIDVPIELRAAPEAVDAANLTELRIRVSYDPVLVKPRIGPTSGPDMGKGIITVGTQLEGGKIVRLDHPIANMWEIDIETARPITSAGGPLFKLTFDSYLGKGSDPVKPYTSPIGIYTYTVDFNNSDGVGKSDQYVLFHDEPGELEVLQNCAKNLRIVNITGAKFAVQPIAPNPVNGNAVINYSIGLAGQTRIALFNSNGVHVMDLVNESQGVGEYELTIDVSTLPAGTYFYRVVSGPYTSESQVLTVVH